MKYIKGVHRHGSETFLIYTKDETSNELKNIIKSSTTKKGINSIISEYHGIKWYNEESEIKIDCHLEKITDNYSRIKIYINKGFFNIETNKPYLKLAKYLNLTLDHYIKIWNKYKKKTYAPFHGDLSLVGNVMFNKFNEVLFVDWEQFDNNNKMPTGSDFIMIIIENVLYESLRSKIIDEKIFTHIKSLIVSLNNADLLSPLLQKQPAQSTLKFIKSNTDIWKGQHFKLPCLKIPEKYILKIDNAINK
ncbi:hypothetical protein OAY25_06270 [Candidatus Pelagibacter sp.]|nr:hypothetical protein [Candidatus Pelagibacter sp.]